MSDLFGFYQYKCRMCNEVFGQLTDKSIDSARDLIGNAIGVSPWMYAIHECANDRIGVADLIGFKSEYARPLKKDTSIDNKLDKILKSLGYDIYE